MTAKEYLNRILDWRGQLWREKADIEREAEMMLSIGGMDYSADRVQKTPETGMPKVERLVDRKMHYDAEFLQYTAEKDRIRAQIEAMGNEMFKNILVYRYICGFRFREIGEIMGYAENTLNHYHGEALRQFGAKYLGTGQ